ncbi:hypothetical protein [Paenibacillus alba]|uniref:Uncharacterized protein n=1 Tax=Paenibacillus alba TaxID=1197127 RepID=A0ABU6GAF1_9BACL|nr:hypothetical protein [Paenibacillus alba]MEC0231170.1 hypothetical protein [Paenibacillus alba]
MNLRDQLTSIQNQLAEEKSKTLYKDLPLISQLEEQEANLLQAIMVEEQNLQNAAQNIKIQQDHETRVIQSTDDFFSKIDSLPISNGMTLRDMIPDEDLYQAAAIQIKGLFQAGIDDISKQLADSQRDYQEAHTNLQLVTTQLNQEKLDHAQTQQYQSNAAVLLDEAQKEIAQLQEQLKTATAGVKTTNTEDEQKKKAELDAKIKREKTIYNVHWEDEIKRINYKANLAATGELITIPAPYIRAYPVIQESEVPQFRQEFGIAETTVTDTDNTATEPVTEDVSSGVTPEETFPTVPSAEHPEVPSVPAPVVTGQPETGVDGKTVEERLSALEAHCFGYVKGQVA